MMMLRYAVPIVVILLVAAPVVTTRAQDARLNFDKLNTLETKARDVIEVNVDGKLLELAKRVTAKVNDAKSKRVAEAISGLRGIYVRVYRFANDNEYNMGDVEQVRSQLTSPGWERLANVRSKQNHQKVDVFTMFSGDKMEGVGVVISESKSVAVVNVIGMIDLEMLVELSGKLNIPKIDIEHESAKPKTDKE